MSTTTAARWSRRLSASSWKNSRILCPLSRSLGARQSPNVHVLLTPSSSSTSSSTAASAACWFSSDATATSSTSTKKKWTAANVKRSKAVIQALEQLPSNLRFDTRSSCIPISIDIIDQTTSSTPGGAAGGGGGVLEKAIEGDEDDADTVIRPLPSSAKHKLKSSSAASSSATTHHFIPAPSHLIAIPLPQRLNVSVHDALDKNLPVGTICLPAHIFGRDPIRVDLIKRAVDFQRHRQRGVRKALAKTVSMVSGSGKKVRQQKKTGGARAGHKRPPHWRGGAVAHGPKGKIQDYGDTKLNAKVRQLAVQHVLSQKLKEQNLIVVDQLQEKLTSHQTKGLASLLRKWNIGGRHGKSALILDVIEEEQVQVQEQAHDVEQEEEGEGHEAVNESDDVASDTLATSTTTAETANAGIIQRKRNPQHIQQGGGLPLKLQVATSNIAHVEAENAWYANVYNILRYEKVILTLAALEVFEKRFKSTAY